MASISSEILFSSSSETGLLVLRTARASRAVSYTHLEGPLDKEEPYSYYSMLNEDVTCYEPDNRDEGEIIEREAD